MNLDRYSELVDKGRRVFDHYMEQGIVVVLGGGLLLVFMVLLSPLLVLGWIGERLGVVPPETEYNDADGDTDD